MRLLSELFSAFKRTSVLLIAGMIVPLVLSSCGPTFPKEHLEEAIKDLCEEEYGLEVQVEQKGKTLGLFYAKEGLLEPTFAIREDAWEDINDLVFSVSRVLLSTDAEVDFYAIIVQDVDMPDIQLVVVKYVKDVKKSMYWAISRYEAFRRTIFRHNITPQAQQEQAVRDIFAMLELDEETQEAVIQEHLKSETLTLKDIGYWRGQFYLKDITKGEFLGVQIANRINLRFNEEDHLREKFRLLSVEGEFVEETEENWFLLNFSIESKGVFDSSREKRRIKVNEILEEFSTMVYGYEFEEFDYLVLYDMMDEVNLKVSFEDIYDYREGPGSLHRIVEAPEGYF